MKRYITLLTLFALAACANPYSQFYHGIPDARVNPYYEALPGDVQIYTTNDFDRDVHIWMRKGYFVVGNSSFNGTSSAGSEGQIRAQAKKVGAQVVLISSKYTHTVTGAMPLTLPNNSTSYSTGSATAYGAGGMVNAYGSGTTTTYGTQTVMMPYSIQRADFGAIYFAKTKSRLGLQFSQSAQIDIETRKRLGTNAGIKIFEIVEGSPAFKANVFPGDILLSIGDDEVDSQEEFVKLLDKYEGQSVTIKLYRDGKILKKNLKILSFQKEETQQQ